ncbi:MAG: class I SAM-dependent methyltransferase [Halieaceae bacterium]|jgi:predicted TPR repeat methyltransferase|nr:class I SAM-dependent methyltransferase [Halieaceae bacterium]MBT6180772.1 class I SAM-dependent methyltransferase [Halieaceae bacterium]
MAGAQADIHTKILTASTTEELMGIYDNWAQGYETQLLDEWGYTSPQTAVKLLASAMQLDEVHVLDAGCGTGLVGLALSEAGVAYLTGIDYSPGMLAEARQKGVYQALDCMDMNQPLAIAADVYDAVTCIGTFTSTHVVPEALFELIRVTRSGGAVVFTVRDDYWAATGFANLVADLHTSGRVVIEQIRLEPYIHSEGSKCRFVVLTVL